MVDTNDSIAQEKLVIQNSLERTLVSLQADIDRLEAKRNYYGELLKVLRKLRAPTDSELREKQVDQRK